MQKKLFFSFIIIDIIRKHLMQILSTLLNNSFTPINNIQQSATLQTLPVLKPLPCDSISFGRSASNADALRKLMEYQIPDMYSGKIVIPPSVIEKFFQHNLFSSSIKNIIKTIIPYETSLHNTEKEVFNLIKNKAKHSPEKKLDEIMKELATQHDTELRKIQQPIFSELEILAQDMPLNQRKNFTKLINIVNKKLVREPICESFNSNEFAYKLQRIADEMDIKKDTAQINSLKRIIRFAQQIPENKDCEISSMLDIPSKAKRNKKIKNIKQHTRKQNEILKKIESIILSSSLRNNKDLNFLVTQTRCKIFGIPQIINFNRKSFIYELQKITNTLEDKQLAKKMICLASQLPKSRHNVSAFIVKAANSSSEKIGYNLLEGSIGNIEHLIPFVKKGKDTLENYGISTAYYNSERGNISMQQQLLRHPETYKNCQKQVNRLIELYNNGTFKKVGLTKWYIINFAKRMYKLSPTDKPLILDLSKLNFNKKDF